MFFLTSNFSILLHPQFKVCGHILKQVATKTNSNREPWASFMWRGPLLHGGYNLWSEGGLGSNPSSTVVGWVIPGRVFKLAESQFPQLCHELDTSTSWHRWRPKCICSGATERVGLFETPCLILYLDLLFLSLKKTSQLQAPEILHLPLYDD